MHNLLRFLKLYHFLLLFILIEGFSIFLLATNNSFQKYTFLNWSQKYTGKIYESSNALKEYLSLKESNNLLAAENAKLYSLLKKQKRKKKETLEYAKNEYIFQEAKVINI